MKPLLMKRSVSYDKICFREWESTWYKEAINKVIREILHSLHYRFFFEHTPVIKINEIRENMRKFL
jgi:hypothetical protein